MFRPTCNPVLKHKCSAFLKWASPPGRMSKLFIILNYSVLCSATDDDYRFKLFNGAFQRMKRETRSSVMTTLCHKHNHLFRMQVNDPPHDVQIETRIMPLNILR
ncbi:uncharacterized protein LOC116769093 isoform X1 [Danaus plexippus]|uniref:uncharacterized protein LOC116769093 isoform X1 n=1 Tax=Danaus plexippus TaxID=13037 RepID=UPI002AB02113|nr:uncharacterized protein LOC116769093 isoform X1 [Danaus plexippus]XP_032515981.2 uncharacterized protein LOC116769093 isoform X1 [Danaus plexippus]